jgi:hypothetical protein
MQLMPMAAAVSDARRQILLLPLLSGCLLSSCMEVFVHAAYCAVLAAAAAAAAVEWMQQLILRMCEGTALQEFCTACSYQRLPAQSV